MENKMDYLPKVNQVVRKSLQKNDKLFSLGNFKPWFSLSLSVDAGLSPLRAGDVIAWPDEPLPEEENCENGRVISLLGVGFLTLLSMIEWSLLINTGTCTYNDPN